MNPFECAWLAGLTDGEGSIYSRRPGNRPGVIETVWTIGMTDRDTIRRVVEIVHALTGRRYKIHQGHNASRRHKLWYRISVARSAALDKLLTALLPFLVTKREQATLLLEIVHRPVRRGQRNVVLPSNVIETHECLKTLNRRGIPSEADNVGTCTDSTPVVDD